ncbi:MAG: hypothetical protein H0X14_13245, partial [Acidobacteria bacterium]|nr:hypothetical protein [Acidobacteriota bacterium]
MDFVTHIRQQLQRRLDAHIPDSSLIPHRSSLIHGIGDDAAVIRQRGNYDSVITTDLLVEDIDFDLDKFHTPPRDVGHKALAVSLSDIAAMGALPRWSLVSVGMPRVRWDASFLDDFYKG